MIKNIFIISLITISASNLIAMEADHTFITKDKESINSILGGIKPYFCNFLLKEEEIKNINFINKPNAIPENLSKKKENKLKENQEAMIKALGKPHSEGRLLSDYLKRVDDNIKELTPEEFLMAAKALRHIDPTENFFAVNPFGDYIAEYMLIEKVIKPFQKKDISKLKKEEKVLLAQAFYELSQVYSHTIDYGKFKKIKKSFFWMIYNKDRERFLNNNYPIDLEEILTNKQKLLRYAVTLAPDAPEVISAWARIIEMNEYDKKQDTEIPYRDVTCKEIYNLPGEKSIEHFEKFIENNKDKYNEKKKQINEILKAKNSNKLNQLYQLYPYFQEMEENLIAVNTKTFPKWK